MESMDVFCVVGEPVRLFIEGVTLICCCCCCCWKLHCIEKGEIYSVVIIAMDK
jgi:hypothetical protein